MPTHPIIAITATTRSEQPADPARVRLNAAYVDAVARAGGVAVVTPPQPLEAADALLGAVDGVLLTGGEDVDPALYGAAPHPALGRVTGQRDAWEIALARGARDRGIPTLGICRGIQVLNVALGGSLVQDIASERAGALEHDQREGRSARTHGVTIVPGSRLAGIMGTAGVVNSLHHQAVDAVAPGLQANAVAPDGVVEGVESATAWWALAVQWHPEELDGADAALFRALVDAARERGR